VQYTLISNPSNSGAIAEIRQVQPCCLCVIHPRNLSPESNPLDPGHGGAELGSRDRLEYPEKDINLGCPAGAGSYRRGLQYTRLEEDESLAPQIGMGGND